MHVKALFVGAILAAVGPTAFADLIPTADGIAVKSADVATPHRGMTKDQVASQFGAPISKVAPVGQPPISRWEYAGFIVYFEGDHVIHTVVSSTPAPASSAPATAPAAAPAGESPRPAGDSTTSAAAPATPSG